MTVKEMHIEFSLGLQKIGALSRRKFQPQEIDRLLNKAQDKFLLDSVKEDTNAQGFVRRQIDVEKVANLISVRNLTKISHTDNVAEFVLPGDYFTLVEDIAQLVRKCSTTVINSNRQVYYWEFQLPRTGKIVGPYYLQYVIDVPGYSQVTIEQALNTWAGVSSTQEEFVAREFIFKALTMKHIPFTVSGNRVTIYGTTPGALNITLDGTTTAIANTEYSLGLQVVSSETSESSTSRLVRNNVMQLLINTPYYKATDKSPISTIQGNTVKLVTSENTIVNVYAISYVRNPQRINVLLHQDCELDYKFHQAIVTQAIAYADKSLERMDNFQANQLEAKGYQ